MTTFEDQMASKNARRRARQAHKKTDRRGKPVEVGQSTPTHIAPPRQDGNEESDALSWLVAQRLPWLDASESSGRRAGRRV